MKKLLLIMPRFFNYPDVIIAELKTIGYDVDFFDDRPSTNSFIKAIVRINKNIINFYIKKYFKSIQKSIRKNKYDVVMLISGQSLSFSEEMIKEIREVQKEARFVLYQWDSQKNFPYIKRMQKYFDMCYSFDRDDVNNTSNLEFLPLFYHSLYEKMGSEVVKSYDYDFCFIGTAHPKKYKLVSDICDQLEGLHAKKFVFFYFPSPLVYLYRKYCNKEFQHASYRDFHYEPLTGEIMNKVYFSSKCIIDSPQAGQNGLTIRTIEALGAKKKIITTNSDIKNYDFYKPENVYIFNGKIDLDDVFFKSSYQEINPNVYKKYSLHSWLLKMLS